MNSYYGCNYRTRTFTQIFPDEVTFIDQVVNSGIPLRIQRESLQTLYYLLYAYYGNSYVASSDENRFKYNMDSIIFQWGPTWEKRIELQDKLRALTDEELERGTKVINNVSYNPSVEPTTDTTDELTTINQQNATIYKKSKLDAYTSLNALLEKDVTKEFLDKFKKLFLIVVAPERPLCYETETDDDPVEGGN